MDCIIHMCSALKHPADYYGRMCIPFTTKPAVVHFHCAMRNQLQYFRKKCRRLRPTVFLQPRHKHTLLLEHNVALFVVLESRHENAIAGTRRGFVRSPGFTILLEHNVALFVVLVSRHKHATAWIQRGFVRSSGVTARTHTTAWTPWDMRLTCCSCTQPTRGTAHYSHSNSSCIG
jgi:hypothetical protein